MPLSLRLFYRLSELAGKWETTENDLLQWGARGNLAISACLNITEAEYGGKGLFNCVFREKIFVKINTTDLLKLAIKPHPIEASKFQDSEGKEIQNYGWVAFCDLWIPESIKIHIEDLLVMFEEVVRMEAENPELRSNEIPVDSLAAAVNGKNNPPIPSSNIQAVNSSKKNTKVSPNDGGRPKGQLTEAVEMAYLHFFAAGNLDILRSGNIRSFLKSFSKLAKDEVPLVEFGNRNIANDIGERIKDVIIPYAGKCRIITNDRRDGSKTKHGSNYHQEAVSKLLTALRKKYPLPS